MLIFINYRQIPFDCGETTDNVGLWELSSRSVCKVWELKVKVKKYFSMSSSLFKHELWVSYTAKHRSHMACSLCGVNESTNSDESCSLARSHRKRNLFKFILHTRVSFNVNKNDTIELGRSWDAWVSEKNGWSLLFDHILVLRMRSSLSLPQFYCGQHRGGARVTRANRVVEFTYIFTPV